MNQSDSHTTRQATVRLISEKDATGKVAEIYQDIMDTKKIPFVPNIWKALANHPDHLELCWTRLKSLMKPGEIDGLTKEIIALAVSVTNGCSYCINSHTRAAQSLGLESDGLGEVMAVIGLFNQMNKLADGFQITPDILPKLD